MLPFLLRCLACLLIVSYALPAAAKPAKKAPPPPETVVLDADGEEEEPAKEPAQPAGKASGKAPAAPPPAPEEVEDDEEKASSGTESAGIECAPAISEIETRRQLPLSCTVTKQGIDQIELRYKAPGRKKWTKVRLRKTGTEFVGDIPCMAITRVGVLRLSIVGMDADGAEHFRPALGQRDSDRPAGLPGRDVDHDAHAGRLGPADHAGLVLGQARIVEMAVAVDDHAASGST